MIHVMLDQKRFKGSSVPVGLLMLGKKLVDIWWFDPLLVESILILLLNIAPTKHWSWPFEVVVSLLPWLNTFKRCSNACLIDGE